KLSGEDPINCRYRQDIGQSYHSLYSVFLDLGRKGDAEEACRQGLAVREKLFAEVPGDPEYGEHLIESQGSLAWLLAGNQKWEESVAWCDKVLATLKQLPAGKADADWAKKELNLAHWRKAEALDALGRHAEAMAA